LDKSPQYGFVTKRDADALDLDRHTVEKLAGRGLLERVAHGVYRFPELPATEYDPYMLAVLWTGTPEACPSHDTALAAYDVCDINPDRIHLTVPRARRIRRRGGDLYDVYYAHPAADRPSPDRPSTHGLAVRSRNTCCRSATGGGLPRPAYPCTLAASGGAGRVRSPPESCKKSGEAGAPVLARATVRTPTSATPAWP
jgi:hypothetical protein